MPEVECREQALRYEAPAFPQGFDEKTRLDFHSPYGCSKGAVDQYMLDYARNYGLKAIVFRHSSIFGGRQFSTFDQGWIGWFVEQALATKRDPGRKPFTISGDGKQVRDVLFGTDLTELYFQAVDAADQAKGQAFNIGGGMENSLSLLELFGFLEAELGVKLAYERLPWRRGDQKVFVADIRKAKELIGWAPKVDKHKGLREMIRWVQGLC
jgi:CDP-paratose 2-epimerase